MDNKTIYDKIAWVFIFIIALFLIGGLVLLGWGFVEFILWVTSK